MTRRRVRPEARAKAGGPDEIKRLYFEATRQTIRRDLARAIALFRELTTEDRERAAVYMDGLAQMRAEWAARSRPPGKR